VTALPAVEVHASTLVGSLAPHLTIVRISIPFLHRAASHPDSARALAETGAAAARSLNWLAYVESWRDFFLLAGTAAVTLAGLLFVALSLHVDALIHESRQHLLALARAIQLSYVLVLTLSLMMLVPGVPLRPSGGYLVVVGGFGMAFTVRQLRTSSQDSHPDFSLAVFRRRLIFPLVGYAWILSTGVAMIALRLPEMLSWCVGGVCMLLGNAVGASWDLLVRTAKIKRREAGASRSGG
jgi:hypothetical protein